MAASVLAMEKTLKIPLRTRNPEQQVHGSRVTGIRRVTSSALLAKVAPLHFRVDAETWRRHPRRTPSVDCAPLVDIRHMKSSSPCDLCGRCSGYRGAVALAPRRFGRRLAD